MRYRCKGENNRIYRPIRFPIAQEDGTEHNKTRNDGLDDSRAVFAEIEGNLYGMRNLSRVFLSFESFGFREVDDT